MPQNCGIFRFIKMVVMPFIWGVQSYLLRLAQYGDGARALARFNAQSCMARKTPSALVYRTLKRRKRRAPLALPPCHRIVRASIRLAHHFTGTVSFLLKRLK